ncbi:trigger factor, partial [Burkholderia pseudomallei]
DTQKVSPYAFDATFEVYPEVKIALLATADVEPSTTTIGDAEIDRTLDILRNQRVHFHARGEGGEHGDGAADTAAQNGDR